jgi:purine-binding chemotaxis protein CheW
MPEQETGIYAEKQLVIFKLGAEEFGVDINEVREIIKLDNITKLPNTESYVDGVINLRGKIIVIIDLAKKLNLPEIQQSKETRIIVIEVNQNTIGMMVDGCNEVLRISGKNIEPAPDIIKRKINSDYLQGVGILKERLIILLDLSKVLEQQELDQVKQVAATAGGMKK